MNLSEWFGLGGALLVAATKMYLLRHDLTGDTYIHLTFARNIASGEWFTYNRGEPSNGSTSPLWSLLLGVLHYVFGERHVLSAARMLAGGFHLASIGLLYALMQYLLPESPLVWIATFVWALNPNAADWAMRAMETPLFIFLLLLGTYLLVVFSVFPALMLVTAISFVAGCLILCRPEGGFWAIGAWGYIVLRTPIMRWPVEASLAWLASATIPCAIVLAPYYLWMMKKFGSIIPSSRARVLHHRQSARRLGPFYYSGVARWHVFQGYYGAFIPFAAVGLISLVIPKLEDSAWPLFVLLGFSGLVIFLFTFVVTGIDYGYRYVLPVLPTVLIMGALGGEVLYKHLPLYASLIFGGPALWSSAYNQYKELRRLHSFMQYVATQDTPVRKRMAFWVRDNLPSGSTIAAKEIDQLAYYSRPGQRILSMDGTIGGAAIEYIEQNKMLEFLIDFQPTHFLLEEYIYRHYPFWSRTKLACLADRDIRVGNKYMLGDMEFELLHEEAFHYYQDMFGTPSSEPYYWRLFRIHYLSTSRRPEKPPKPVTTEE